MFKKIEMKDNIYYQEILELLQLILEDDPFLIESFKKNNETDKLISRDELLLAIEEVSSDEWEHKYSRSEAVFPHSYLYNNKYWSPVARIDNVYGDRNLFCVCPPIEDYEDVSNA